MDALFYSHQVRSDHYHGDQRFCLEPSTRSVKFKPNPVNVFFLEYHQRSRGGGRCRGDEPIRLGQQQNKGKIEKAFVQSSLYD